MLALLFSSINYNSWKIFRAGNPFYSDANQYYSYLVATFIKHDLTFNFPNDYWLFRPKNIAVPKVSMGTAYMYSPFFAIGHCIASNSEKFLADGYSKPYAYSIYYGSILYCLLGLLILRKLLLIFFDEWPTTLTLFSIFFATNLFFYALSWPVLSHGYLFFLYALLLYLVVKWHQTQKMSTVIGIGFLIGLIAVIRPLDVVIALIPLLYGISSKETLLHKIQLIKTNYLQVFVAFCFFWIPIIPQLIYWKWATGEYLYFSYGGAERFFFNDPQIFNLLFSYRKGWLLYTPIMIFAIIGMFQMKRIKDFTFATILYTVLIIYLLSCWWCWWYGGCFGMRALIQSYALFALPMAAFYTVVWQKNFLRFVLIPVILLFGYLNICQAWQYKSNILHWDGNTKEVYWGVFGIWDKANVPPGVYDHLDEPDYEKARLGYRD